MSEPRWNGRPVESDLVHEPLAGHGTGGDPFRWARIRNVDRMRPFLTTLASSSDHWGFLSSLGSLTAGRRNVSQALFPYRTVDRIHDVRGRVGGMTMAVLEDGERVLVRGHESEAPVSCRVRIRRAPDGKGFGIGGMSGEPQAPSEGLGAQFDSDRSPAPVREGASR